MGTVCIQVSQQAPTDSSQFVLDCIIKLSRWYFQHLIQITGEIAASTAIGNAITSVNTRTTTEQQETTKLTKPVQPEQLPVQPHNRSNRLEIQEWIAIETTGLLESIDYWSDRLPDRLPDKVINYWSRSTTGAIDYK